MQCFRLHASSAGGEGLSPCRESKIPHAVGHGQVSQKEKSRYISAYVWNLEKWYWWTYLQGRNRDTDIEIELVDIGGEGEGGSNWEHSKNIYTLLLLSHFSRLRLCATPSLGFSRQEHWSGLPFPSPVHESEKWKWSCSVVSDSLLPHRLQPARLLHPWDFPGKSTGVGCRCLLWYIHYHVLNIEHKELSVLNSCSASPGGLERRGWEEGSRRREYMCI